MDKSKEMKQYDFTNDHVIKMKPYNFIIEHVIGIEAADISEAVKQFHNQYPDTEIKQIKQGETPIACERSKHTGEKIYYVPGCPCKDTDCIFDPMMTIAEECDHQSDMTSDKWKPCDYYEPYDHGCYNYDDECK